MAHTHTLYVGSWLRSAIRYLVASHALLALLILSTLIGRTMADNSSHYQVVRAWSVPIQIGSGQETVLRPVEPVLPVVPTLSSEADILVKVAREDPADLMKAWLAIQEEYKRELRTLVEREIRAEFAKQDDPEAVRGLGKWMWDGVLSACYPGVAVFNFVCVQTNKEAKWRLSVVKFALKVGDSWDAFTTMFLNVLTAMTLITFDSDHPRYQLRVLFAVIFVLMQIFGMRIVTRWVWSILLPWWQVGFPYRLRSRSRHCCGTSVWCGFRVINVQTLVPAPPLRRIVPFVVPPAVAGPQPVNIVAIREGETGSGSVYELPSHMVPQFVKNNLVALGYRTRDGRVHEGVGFAMVVRWSDHWVLVTDYHVVDRIKTDARSNPGFQDFVAICRLFEPGGPKVLSMSRWQQAACAPAADFYALHIPPGTVGFLQPSALPMSALPGGEAEINVYLSRSVGEGRREAFLIKGHAQRSAEDEAELVVHASLQAGDCGVGVIAMVQGKPVLVGLHKDFLPYSAPRGTRLGESHAVALGSLVRTHRHGRVFETLPPELQAEIDEFQRLARGDPRFAKFFDIWQDDLEERFFEDPDDFRLDEVSPEELERLEREAEEYFDKRAFGYGERGGGLAQTKRKGDHNGRSLESGTEHDAPTANQQFVAHLVAENQRLVELSKRLEEEASKLKERRQLKPPPRKPVPTPPASSLADDKGKAEASPRDKRVFEGGPASRDSGRGTSNSTPTTATTSSDNVDRKTSSTTGESGSSGTTQGGLQVVLDPPAGSEKPKPPADSNQASRQKPPPSPDAETQKGTGKPSGGKSKRLRKKRQQESGPTKESGPSFDRTEFTTVSRVLNSLYRQRDVVSTKEERLKLNETITTLQRRQSELREEMKKTLVALSEADGQYLESLLSKQSAKPETSSSASVDPPETPGPRGPP